MHEYQINLTEKFILQFLPFVFLPEIDRFSVKRLSSTKLLFRVSSSPEVLVGDKGDWAAKLLEIYKILMKIVITKRNKKIEK